MEQLTLKANAKINLFLEVLDKRPDGYHNIETVFQSIDLYDIIQLTVNNKKSIFLDSNNPGIPMDSTNIAYKAAQLLIDETRGNWGIHIHIEKLIPIGAGLAGGSADAAAVLVGLNELLDLNYTTHELMKLGNRIGSDVPFCILGGTALGHDRGDKITPLNPFHGVPLVLANPGFQVSTAWAYNNLGNLGLTRKRKSANILVNKLCQKDIIGVSGEMYNVFEDVVMKKYPQVRLLKDNISGCDTLGAMMTGSGPTVFALARNVSSAENIRGQINRLVDFCIATKTSNVSIVKK
ncbi:4-(cytidine 5'-diphospho)-2-C-methyl-D-erythritol kinase [Candidatus Poribacteria bacterium]|nr:4-(cytidine 5'-diphospho)-2-C-methyl-D-erythritol kinase [Candidatus Poribacteria bacterium]